MTASSSRQAAKQRAYRRRQSDGEIVAPVPLTYSEIHLLIAAGTLHPDDEEDRRKIGEGVRKLISAIAKERYR